MAQDEESDRLVAAWWRNCEVCDECGHHGTGHASTCSQYAPPPTWEQQRKAVADKWFGGDEDRAEAVMDALPYSDIPRWADVEAVMLAAKPSSGNIDK